jgi:LPS-assembly protein
MLNPTTLRRWLITLGLLLSLSLFAQPQPQLSSNDPISADLGTGELIAAGNARFEHEDVVIEAEEIRFNRKSSEITGTGNVRVTRHGLRVVSEFITYNIKSEQFSSKAFRAGVPPLFIEGLSFGGTLDELSLEQIRLYYLEPSKGAPSLVIDNATVVPEESISGKGVGLKIPFLPKIPLPSFERPLAARAHNAGGTAGYRSSLGAYIEGDVLLPSDTLRLGANLGLYTRRGVLIGPKIELDRTSGGATTELSISAGWIADQGESATFDSSGNLLDTGVRGLDLLGDAIPQHRYYAEVDFVHKIDDLEIVLRTSTLSDSEVERDFRSDRYYERPHSDSFLEVNQLIGDDLFLSLIVENNPNDFFRNVERQPEIIFQMPLNPIGKTDLLHAFKARFLRLRVNGSSPVTQPLIPFWPKAIDLRTSGPTSWSTLVEVDYSLRYPIKFGTGFQITPLAEVTGHGYAFETEGPSSKNVDTSGTRLAIGFDARALLSADFALSSKAWNMTGLRHILEPVIQGRYIRATGDSALSEIFPTFTATRTDFDLITRRDRPNLDNHTYALRSGFHNTFIARKDDGTRRTLGNVGIFYDTSYDAYQKRTFSSAYFELTAKPASWLELSVDRRFDFTDNDDNEMRLRMQITSGEKWELGFAVDFLDDRYDQYQSQVVYHLDTRRSLIAAIRFDALTSELTEQTYGVRYRLGRTWEFESYVTFREGAEREDDVAFGLRMRLLDF